MYCVAGTLVYLPLVLKPLETKTITFPWAGGRDAEHPGGRLRRLRMGELIRHTSRGANYGAIVLTAPSEPEGRRERKHPQTAEHVVTRPSARQQPRASHR